ncbi:MAG: ABC transporter substrate-binding protein [Lachnospiraceae bacterium]|jgi:spermidine/putrescine transport system substrate-binding protein
MKKIALFLTVFIFAAMFLPSDVKAAKTVTITVYNWGQYIADGTDDCADIIKLFEEAYPDIKVNYLTFDSNETMYTKLKTGGDSYDVIVPSDYMVEKLIEEDMLLELNFDNIPNYEYVDDNFKYLPYDPENKYSVPYTWGHVGLIYNSKYVNEEDATGWELMWNPTYAGKILMFDNCRDAFAIGESLLGYSLNTEDPDELAAVAAKLDEQKYLIQSYVMDQIFERMEREEAWIAPYYAGDFLTMYEENDALRFLTPDQGFNVFTDALCIPKSARHKEEAECFINFLCEPEISGLNMDYICYSSPISAAKEYMDEELASSEIIYPPEDLLSKGEAFFALSMEGTQLMNRLWLDVKAGDDMLASYLWITGGAIVFVIALWLFFKIRRARRIARRCTHLPD